MNAQRSYREGSPHMDRRLAVLALGTFAIGTNVFVIAGILGAVAASLDVSVGVAGQLVTAYAVAYAPLAPILAAATGRWSRRRVLLVALVVFTAGNALTALAPTYGTVLAARVLTAAGAALFTPGASAAAVSLVAPEHRGRALAVVMGGVSVATAVGVPLGTWLGTAVGWRATLWLVTGLGVLALAGVWAWLTQLPRLPALGLRARLLPLRDRRIAVTLATTVTVMTAAFTVYTFAGAAFAGATGGDGTRLAWLLLIFGLGAVVATLVAGRWSDRYGPARVLRVGLAAFVVTMALLPVTSMTLATAMPAVAVWAVSGWAVAVPLQHRLVELAPAAAPLTLALNASGMYVGISLASVAGSVGLATVGAHLLGAVAAAIGLAGVGVAEVSLRLRTREAVTEPT